MATVFSKLGVDVFAPTTAGGELRSVINGETQAWAAEVERLLMALIAGQGGSITLPNLLIRFTITGGTANAIVATPNLIPPTTPATALFSMIVAQNNTGPVTINGKPLRTNGGEDIAAGEIAANDFLLFIDLGDHYRLTMDTGSLRNKTAAQAAQVAAELARNFARRWASDPEDGPPINDGVNPVGQSAYHWSRKSERARDIAAGYASDAVSQGNVPIYATVMGMPALEIPEGINAIRINGHDYAGDGRGGIAVDEDNGTDPWFTTADGRTWWLAADVGYDRLTDDLRSAVVMPSIQDIYSKSVRVCPIEWPDMIAAMDAYGLITNPYPGYCFLDEVAQLLFINYGANILVIRRWPSFEYVSTFQAVGAAASWGWIEHDGSTRYLVKRYGTRAMAKYNITELPPNLGAVSAAITYPANQVDAYVYGTYRDGVATINSYTEPWGGIRLLSQFRQFDSEFNRLGVINFNISDMGVLTGPLYRTSPHVQCFEDAGGFFFTTIGGNVNRGATAPLRTYDYAGVRLLGRDGALMMEGPLNPHKVMDILEANGIPCSRLEAEGGFVTRGGELWSMHVHLWATTGTDSAGLLFMREFSREPDAIDFSAARVAPVSKRMTTRAGVIPRESGAYINPETGLPWTGLNEICDFMALVPEFNYVELYSNYLPSEFQDINGIPRSADDSVFLNASHITLRSLNTTTFHLEIRTARHGDVQYYVLSGSPRAQNLINSKFSAHRSNVAQVIPPGLWTMLNFTAERYNIGGKYDPLQSRWVPGSRFIRLEAMAEFSSGLTAGELIGLAIYQNGSPVTIVERPAIGNRDHLSVFFRGLPGNASTYYEVYAYAAGAGDKTVSGSAARTKFEGETV